MTITTTAFEDLVRSTLKDQGVSDMAIVAVEHPIAGRNEEQTKNLVDGALPSILKAATEWQPGN